jgi:hypothetical protein
VAQRVFRSDVNVQATAAALMAQIKGIAHHAAMREREPGEIDAILSTVAAQVEHWLTCRARNPLPRSCGRGIRPRRQENQRSSEDLKN